MSEGPQRTRYRRTRYRVVGLLGGGARDVRAFNVFRTTAEAIETALIASGDYQRVVVERQPQSKERDEGPP